jgi:hypothetical protein
MHRPFLNHFGSFISLVAFIMLQKSKIKSQPTISSVESLKARSLVDFDRIAEQQHKTYTFSSMLHKNQAGPNPIGNEYPLGNTIHNVKKLRYPPPQV